MRNVSNEFIELMRTRTDFKEYADIEFTDGTTLTLEAKDFTIGNNSVNETSDSESLPIGSTISQKIKICLMNNEDQYSVYDFVGAKIRLYLKFELSSTVETIDFGTFTVTDPETYGVTVNITAYDDMYKADKKYTTGLAFPQTAGAVLRDICSTCNISLYSATFWNSDYVITEQPSNEYTFRQVIGWISMIAGGNARINRSGSLEIITYDFSKVSKIIDGGTFSPWTTGDTLDGGTFNPWTTGDVVDGGAFGDRDNIHVLHAFKNLTVDTDDIVITGVSMSDDDSTIMYGEEGYLINVENPLVTDKNYFVQLLGDVLIGAQFRKFSGDHIAYPLAEAMDLAIVIDRKGNAYSTIITDVNFVFFGFTTLKNSASSPVRNSSTYNAQSVSTYVKAKNLIQKNKTEFDKAIEELSTKLSQTEGAYTTIETLESGGSIFYLHNKPTLAESKMIWKMTAEAWAVSTDGGTTWNGGMTVDGVVIAKILNTIGVNADWINTGALTVKDSSGNTIFSVDMDTNSVYINGSSVVIGGKSATQALRDAVTEAENYSDDKLATYADTVTKDVENLQAQIDGQIETYYYDYEPTLLNYPASEWTTTEERTKHIGDIFYWKSQGYSYRFFQDGSTWKWQLVQDTDITKAMAAAENAQDTADGKRRVFVVTPAPPYDIGDLWSQSAEDGGELLTCNVSRASGSYVSSDWAKYNKYTDDTKAEEALAVANSARALSIVMSNEYQGVPTDANGNYTTFPTVTTKITTYFGHTDVSSSCSYSVSTSSGITGSWNSSTRIYTVTALTADTAYVDITATYLSAFTVTKRFTVAKVKSGATGPQGASGVGVKTVTNYYLATNSSSGVTTSTSGWTTTVQSVSSSKKYLWNYEVITYTNNTTSSTTPNIIGAYGDTGATGPQGATGSTGATGATGNGISSITEYYARSTSNSTVPTSWVTTVPTLTTTYKYLWNYETINYTNGTTADTKKRVIGVYGDTGNTGATGAAGRTYFLQPSTLIMKIGADSVISPSTVTFSAYYRDGASATRTAYACRFIIAESTDGSSYTTKYTSSSNESSKTYTPSSADVVAIRCTMYAAGGTTTALDVQTVTLLIDVDNLTQEQIFNILTNNGTVQGIYLENGKVYINASYIKSGTLSADLIKGGVLKIGGSSNEYGSIEIYDSSDVLAMDITEDMLRYHYTDTSGVYYLYFSGEGIKLKRSAGIVDYYMPNGIEVDYSNGTINANFTSASIIGLEVTSTTTVTSGTTAVFDSSNYIRKLASSSERYKEIERTLTAEDIENLYNIEVYLAKYKDDYLSENDERYRKYMPMFTVENMEKFLPIAVNHNADGSPEMWNAQIMIPVMFQMLKSQKEEIDNLKNLLSMKGVI